MRRLGQGIGSLMLLVAGSVFAAPAQAPDLEEQRALERVRELVSERAVVQAGEIAREYADKYADLEPLQRGSVHRWRSLAECLPRDTSRLTDPPSGLSVALAADQLGLNRLALATYGEHMDHGPARAFTAKWNIACYMAHCALREGDFAVALASLQRSLELAEEPYLPRLREFVQALERRIAHSADPVVHYAFVRSFLERQYPPYQSPLDYAAPELEGLLRRKPEPALRASLHLALFGYARTVKDERRATLWALRMALDADFAFWNESLELGSELPLGVHADWSALADIAQHLEDHQQPAAAIAAWRPFLGDPAEHAALHEAWVESITAGPQLEIGFVALNAQRAAHSISRCYEQLGDDERALEFLLRALNEYGSFQTCGSLSLEADPDEERARELERRIRERTRR